MIHRFYSAKGGQGTTTVAVLWALHQARTYERRLVLADRTGDMSAHLDLAATTPYEGVPVIDGVTYVWMPEGDPTGDAVIDEGVVSSEPGPNTVCRRHMVLRGPCYLALRRAVMLGFSPHDVILIREPGRTLRERDVESVVGAPVSKVIDVNPNIARAVDAGLLCGRIIDPFVVSDWSQT